MKFALLTVTAVVAATSLCARAECRRATLPVCDGQISKPAPSVDLSAISPLRRSILKQAASQIGVVSELIDTDCNKRGWREFIEYHEVAFARELDARERRISKKAKTAPGQKVKEWEWCGIFALWAVKTGALAVEPDSGAGAGDCSALPPEGPLADLRGAYLPYTRWVPGKVGGIDGLPQIHNAALAQPGDIVVFKGDLYHHAIVEKIEGGMIHTIDGNIECGMVARRTRPLSEVRGFYQVE